MLCFLDSVLTIEPNWSTFFAGESVTLICDMREGLEADWYYTILKDGQEYVYHLTNKIYTLGYLLTGDSGEYQCFGRYKGSTDLKKSSNKVSLTVSGRSSTLYQHDQFTESTYFLNQVYIIVLFCIVLLNL